MRNLLVALAVLFGLSLAARADDGMHGGWCPTDGNIYEILWLDNSFTCIDVGGGQLVCVPDYECVFVGVMAKANPAPSRFGREPMDADKRRNA